MRLSEGLIAKFQKMHLEVVGARISPETAEAELLDLAELVLIMQPVSVIADEDGRNDE
jgi:hypothetical protein